MDGNRPAADDRLAQWRAQQLDHHDPVQFAFLEALQRRAQASHGALRRVLDARLETLLDAHAARLAASAAAPVTVATAATMDSLATLGAARSTQASTYPALPALAQFRTLWAQLRTAGQVRQTLAQSPSDGGPLNSSVLVHRTIGWMGDVSPAYLEHFLAYVDNLAWLEQMQQRGTLPSRDSAPGRAPAKPRRARSPR
ncbi:DUF2894 domain-containing protein [Stenotrophomonas sp.]|uniref:DUF2894 domain-containing protein n=1 Tax=Stenotrophomonas sp. TaxID=69392 RepID=UPI0028AE31B5|nr:DUF2894 domain-containing protein [Stenotrophomonas sp.]